MVKGVVRTREVPLWLLVVIVVLSALFISYLQDDLLTGAYLQQTVSTNYAVPLEFVNPSSDGNTIYTTSSDYVDILLRSSDPFLEITSLVLEIDNKKYRITPELVSVPSSVLVRTGHYVGGLADGIYNVKAYITTPQGSGIVHTSFVVDKEKPQISLEKPIDNVQKLTVTDNYNVVHVRMHAYNDNEWVTLADPVLKRGTYEATLPQGNSWDSIMYTISDSDYLGNVEFALAVGTPEKQVGRDVVYAKFPPIVKIPATSSSQSASETCGFYRGIIYAPFFYYSGVFDPSHPDNKAERQSATENEVFALQQRLQAGLGMLNLQMASYGYNVFSGDFVEVEYIPLALDYWETFLEEDHPYFYPIKDAQENIIGTGYGNYIIDIATGSAEPNDVFDLDPNAHDPLNPALLIIKPVEKEAIFLVDEILISEGVVNQGTSCGLTFGLDGAIFLRSTQIPDSFCDNLLFTGYVHAHEMAHSLGLDHTMVVDNLMCSLDSGSACTFSPALTVNQARGLNGHLCGNPANKLQFISTFLWWDSEFGVNKKLTNENFACANGAVGYYDECEESIVKVEKSGKWNKDLLTFCPEQNPVDGVTKWPDYSRLCVGGPIAPGGEEKCICKTITPINYGGSSASGAGSTIAPKTVSPPPSITGGGQSPLCIGNSHDPSSPPLSAEQCCGEPDCPSNDEFCLGGAGIYPGECESCEFAWKWKNTNFPNACRYYEDCPTLAKQCVCCEGNTCETVPLSYDQQCLSCKCVDPNPPCNVINSACNDESP